MNQSSSFIDESMRKDGPNASQDNLSPYQLSKQSQNRSYDRLSDQFHPQGKTNDSTILASQERSTHQQSQSKSPVQETTDFSGYSQNSDPKLKRELEAVPERSIEQSEPKTLLSRNDTEAYKTKEEYDQNGVRTIKSYASYSNQKDPLYESGLESKYLPRGENRPPQGLHGDQKGGESDRGTFYSPRF